MRESTLYGPVKRFLEAQGFEVKGEVGPCDLVAVRGGDPPLVVVAELKLGFSLDLVLQAVDRMACADQVWLAVLATRKGRDRDGRARKLCRLLGLGLLAVEAARGRVEVLVEPGPYRPRADGRRRARLVREHAARRGDPSPGGVRGVPIFTAYRQDALACAALLRGGPASTRVLAGATPRATSIVYRNVYGWFMRVGRGVYGLTPVGEAALERWVEDEGSRAGDVGVAGGADGVPG